MNEEDTLFLQAHMWEERIKYLREWLKYDFSQGRNLIIQDYIYSTMQFNLCMESIKRIVDPEILHAAVQLLTMKFSM